jgi:hypothetical protein
MNELKEKMNFFKSPEEKAKALAEYLSEIFNGVEKNDIAVLFEKAGALSFVYPDNLKSCAVPIDEKSTAGKTFKNQKTFIFNKFPEVSHISLFEKFVKDENSKTLPIQKIISTPILKNGKTIGVVQVSRKGKASKDCADFTKEDGLKVLKVLKSIIDLF